MTLMLLRLLILKMLKLLPLKLRLLPLKKEKPLQPGHCLLQDLVLRKPSFGADCLLFCIKFNSKRLGTGISITQPLVEFHHLKRRRQKLMFLSDWPLDAWRITTFSTRIELTRRRR